MDVSFEMNLTVSRLTFHRSQQDFDLCSRGACSFEGIWP